MNNKHYSLKINVFHGRQAPETGTLVGYGAIIEAHALQVPLPETLALISAKKRRYRTQNWQILTPRHEPENNLYKQLVFALKYEGVNLLVLKRLFIAIDKTQITEIIASEKLGQYSRKLWFLYEWLLQEQLDIHNLTTGNYVPLLDEKLQFAITGTNSSRQRIINNLPGTHEFCPLTQLENSSLKTS